MCLIILPAKRNAELRSRSRQKGAEREDWDASSARPLIALLKRCCDNRRNRSLSSSRGTSLSAMSWSVVNRQCRHVKTPRALRPLTCSEFPRTKTAGAGEHLLRLVGLQRPNRRTHMDTLAIPGEPFLTMRHNCGRGWVRDTFTCLALFIFISS
jgi:hypothetical protein